MKNMLKSSLLATLAVAATCLLPTPAQAGQEKLAAQIAETSQQVGETRNQLQATGPVMRRVTFISRAAPIGAVGWMFAT